MEKINLISSKRRLRAKKSWYKIILYSLFGLYVLYFLFTAGSLVFRMIKTNSDLTKIKSEVSQVSSMVLSESSTIQQYVTAKLILDKILDLNSKKFPYKQYLDQVFSLLPPGNVIKNVDFSVKDMVIVTMESNTDSSFATAEKQFRNMNLDDYDFSSVSVEGVNRVEGGVYRTNLIFEFKKDARK